MLFNLITFVEKLLEYLIALTAWLKFVVSEVLGCYVCVNVGMDFIFSIVKT